MYMYIAETVRGLLPMMEYYGVASAEEVMVDNLADRLRIEMTTAGAVSAAPCLIGAWTRKLDTISTQLIDAASARQFLRCRSEALSKAFLLTPRDTDVSWSLRNPEAGSLGDDQPKLREEK
jgi:hypothetical protein